MLNEIYRTRRMLDIFIQALESKLDDPLTSIYLQSAQNLSGAKVRDEKWLTLVRNLIDDYQRATYVDSLAIKSNSQDNQDNQIVSSTSKDSISEARFILTHLDEVSKFRYHRTMGITDKIHPSLKKLKDQDINNRMDNMDDETVEAWVKEVKRLHEFYCAIRKPV